MSGTIGLALQLLVRDWRAGEMRLMLLALVIAVASLTSVNFFTDRVQRATESQASELLAADLVVVSRQPPPVTLRPLASTLALQSAETVSMPSMVLAGEVLQMADIKAVETGYPLRGELRTSDRLFGPETATAQIPAPGTAWVDARLLQLLDIPVGSPVQVGALTLIISRILTHEPDRGGEMFNIAPRLLMNSTDLPATGLIQPASRLEYRLLLAGGSESITQFRRRVTTDYPDLRLQGIRNARPELRRALERAEQFLGLAALVSLALAGLAVALSARLYAARHLDHCAVMRCLGAEQTTITKLYLIQLGVLALAGSVGGCLLGYLAQQGLALLLSGMVQGELPRPGYQPLFTGLLAGTATVVGFAMPQLIRLRRVSPLRVLRRDLSPLPLHGILVHGVALGCLVALSPWQSGSAVMTAYTLAGIALTALLLAIGARLLIALLHRYRHLAGSSVRFGLANVVRRSGLSTAQILGLGLGIMVMLLLGLIRTDLLSEWRDRLPEGTPNYFLINIQERDITPLQSFLSTRNGNKGLLYPMVRARLTTINDTAVEAGAIADEQRRRRATREYNLTWSATLPAANRVIEGQWWTDDDAGPQLSIEKDFAADLGVGIGDTLTFLVAGAPVRATVTNLREVDWDSFNVNFFVVASPATLAGLPASYVTSFHLPAERRELLIDLVRQFPNITVFDVDALITEVRLIMDQVIRTVEFVFLFTLLSGFVVLLAAMQTTHTERRHETALLASLGASRSRIRTGLLAEFASLGLLAGTLATAAAILAGQLLATRVFRLDFSLDAGAWLAVPLVCAIGVALLGWLGTRSVLDTPPMVALRR